MLCIRLVSSLAEVFGSFGFERASLFPMIFSVADPYSLYILSLHFPSVWFGPKAFLVPLFQLPLSA